MVVVGSWSRDTQGPPKATGGSLLRLSSCLQHRRGKVSALNTYPLKSGIEFRGPNRKPASEQQRSCWLDRGKSTIIEQKGGRPEDEFWEVSIQKKGRFPEGSSESGETFLHIKQKETGPSDRIPIRENHE